ncbi:hypothetical protein [Pseudonocardia sp. EV170527-09]|uniref:hypothetical protein n=1 Tax=Pseudonocardia sp. EV170527-09 TaxID=2603411 RepID=UPI0013868B5E|nr:hypothetical protein [Pseudonocardia sp. EV170527-09]
MGAVAQAPVQVRSWSRGVVFTSATGRVTAKLSQTEMAVALALSGATWRSRADRPSPEQLARIVMAVVLRHGGAHIARHAHNDRATTSAERNATTTQLRAQRALWGSARRAQQCTDAAFVLRVATDRGHIRPTAAAA